MTNVDFLFRNFANAPENCGFLQIALTSVCFCVCVDFQLFGVCASVSFILGHNTI